MSKPERDLNAGEPGDSRHMDSKLIIPTDKPCIFLPPGVARCTDGSPVLAPRAGLVQCINQDISADKELAHL